MTTARSLRTLAIALVVLSSLLAGSALAETKTHPTAKVSLDIPSGWATKSDANTMIVTDPTTDLAFILVVSDAADLKKSFAGVDKMLDNVITDLKWPSPPKAMKLNGMNGLKNEGTAKAKGSGQPASLGLFIVETPAKKALVVVAVVETTKLAAHKAEIKAFMNSLKPAP
jgi:hypothetical protein